MSTFTAGFNEASLDRAKRCVMELIRKLAIEGTKEKTAAHGICVILVPDAKLDFVFSKDEDGDPVFGRISDSMYDFRANPVPFDQRSTFQSCAREDGAMLVTESQTLLCGNFFVTDTRKGDNTGGKGARLRRVFRRSPSRCGGLAPCPTFASQMRKSRNPSRRKSVVTFDRPVLCHLSRS